MGKRKLYSDLVREEVESTRVLRLRFMKTSPIDSSGGVREKKLLPEMMGKGTSIIQSSKLALSLSSLDGSTEKSPPLKEHSRSLPLKIPNKPPASYNITILNILTVISKSLSGLRLRQNLVLLNRIHPDFQSYASAISRSALLADKLLAFRTSGPSFNAIKTTLLPSPETEINQLFLIRWIIMRLYAFGHPDLITSLGTINSLEDVLKAREVYKKSTGFSINSLPVYGNVRFDPKRISGHLSQVFSNVPKLFATITKLRQQKGSAISFREVMGLIGKASIPYYSPGSIFQWLLACDLAELDEIVVPPTARDLAMRIECFVKEKRGGSGTWNGLVKGIEEHDWPEVSVDALTTHLEWVYNNTRENLSTQEILFRKKGFWYSDLEHCLCKVIRSEKY